MTPAVSWLRRLAVVLLLVVSTLAVVTARAVMTGESAMARSDDAFDHGALRDAILHARAGAVAYAPGAPHVQAAYERLHAIAVGAEASGDDDVARAAWEALRAAALETRDLWIAHPDQLERANRNLSRLMARSAATGAHPMKREAAAAYLDRDDAPRAAWVLVLGFGFACMALGLGLFASRGVTADGRWVASRVRWPAVVTVVGVACWTIAVYKA